MQSTGRFHNVSLVNQLLRSNDITVTLQWPREAGAVYHVNVLPETSHIELTNAMSHNSIMINLTISYNIGYNVSIISRLCGITTTKVLKYGKLYALLLLTLCIYTPDYMQLPVIYQFNYYIALLLWSLDLRITLQ